MTPRPTPPTSPDLAFVTVARILRARGRIGEVAAEILTDFPERLTALAEVWLGQPGGAGDAAPRRANVRRCWLHNDRAIFHFEGVDNISDAEKLAGLLVQIPLAQRMLLPPGRYYISELVGCEVWEQSGAAGGGRIGVVRDVQLNTGTPLLVVQTQQGELLIPLADEICPRIDIAARRIEVTLPEGLRELNAP